LGQTFRDFEVIAMDDTSNDNSREVLARYAEQAPMRLVFNERNSGSPFRQWRRGAELAVGKYLWIAESDDYADVRLLEVLVSEIERNPTVGLAYCQSFNVDAHDQVLGTWECWTQDLDADRWKRNFVNRGTDEVARYLVRRNTIPNASAVLVRKDLLLDASREAEWMRLCGDWWIWSRVLMQTDVAFVAEPLNYFRSHMCSVRGSLKSGAVYYSEMLSVIAHICSQAAVPPALRQQVLHEALNCWRQCFDSAEFVKDWSRLWQMHGEVKRVDRSATRQIAWFLLKRALKRIGPIAAGVRTVKHMGGRCRT
jgi:glycosyltransferase involved in cell wall biosynthesis